MIVYINDGSITWFNVSSPALTWARKPVLAPKDSLGNSIKQGANPAGCLGGDGKYYSFGGLTSVYIEQWDPINHTVTCFGAMPDVIPGSTNPNSGSNNMCCVSVPGYPNLIFVTLNPSIYGYDYALFDISANLGSTVNCGKGAWLNRTTCRNLPNYNADLTLRDCSTCGGNIVLGPGGAVTNNPNVQNPNYNLFTVIDLSGAGPACQYITGGDVVNTTAYYSMVPVPPSFAPSTSAECQATS